MSVTLEIPYTRSGVWRPDGRPRPIPLSTGPMLARSHGSTRWHRIRSGSVHPAWGELFQDSTHFTYWCGQGQSTGRAPRNGAVPGILTADALPDDGTPLCGACEGKAIGAVHPSTSALTIAQPGRLMFEPTRMTPPKLCPSSQRGGQSLVIDHGRTALCLVCGETIGWWGSRLRRHAPGPGLIPGCEFHLWNGLVRCVGDVVACRCMTDGAHQW